MQNILFSLLMFFSTCSLSEPSTVSGTMEDKNSLHLLEPTGKTNDAKEYDGIETKLSLLLLADNSIFAYEGADVSKGGFYTYKNIAKKIKASKKKFGGKEFVVVIKPTKKASYKNAVDILDEMTINSVEKFHLNDPSAEEEYILPKKSIFF